jgi:hypothetical protein
MSQRKKKNKPVRNKQLARQKAARAKRTARLPLRRLRPPFTPYDEWIEVPADARGLTEFPFTPEMAAELGADEQDFLNRVVRLGPLYDGIVPMAAVYLDSYISDGEIPLAVWDEPDEVRFMPVAMMAADLSDPSTMERIRQAHPQAGLPEEVREMTVEDCARSLHKLHAHGYLVLNDDHVLHFAQPPKVPGGTWLLNGRPAAE